ncbi:uncharacterized protein KY384_002358 [Bacidia gigantensis]|uniref:uncharacterized protein n=1 Tax=Bacidia gigantensis TaxID=2732470 RepID=UPI001D055CAB|nr:uncharacterized protein KY384_002358 [Bacidia gigantensis]KAG8532481.1 hypothetical protein KY384_002358 [Bacidia gigantensis]
MSVTDSSPLEIAKAASISSRNLAITDTSSRNDALTAIHGALSEARETILAANAEDLKAANKAAEDGKLSQSVIKRLDLSRPGKYDDMLKGILDVRKLEDPLNQTTLKTILDDELVLERVSCPIGVLLIIFEARPEVIANISALAIKSGNSAILKGGKETTLSFLAISKVISSALSTTQIPNSSIQLVTTHADIASLLDLDQYIDLVIPRGSSDLVRYIKTHTRIPVLGHADGICNTYVTASADPSMAVKLVLDAKLDYLAACNALDILLIDEAALTTVLPPVATALIEKGVSLRCDASSKTALSSSLPRSQSVLLQDAEDKDFSTEFLGPTIAIKTVPTPTASSADNIATAACTLAIAHINANSSHHTDAIITAVPSSSDSTDEKIARQFQRGVDSACVFWNTSTRMSDGMRFGFGTEVGISTNKIHARGPVGLEGLTIYKYLVSGRGQGVGDYAGEAGRKWRHEKVV